MDSLDCLEGELHPKAIAAVRQARFTTKTSILHISVSELQRQTKLTLAECAQIMKRVSESVVSPHSAVTAFDLLPTQWRPSTSSSTTSSSTLQNSGESGLGAEEGEEKGPGRPDGLDEEALAAIADAEEALQAERDAAQETNALPVASPTQCLTLGSKPINALLRGGVLTRGITEIAGESGGGKTQLALQLCLAAQLPASLGGLGGAVVYISTEGAFPNKRLEQMIKAIHNGTSPLVSSHTSLDDKARVMRIVSTIDFADSIFVEHADRVENLWEIVTQRLPILMEKCNVRLVVIDSITGVFRGDTAHQSDTSHRASELFALSASLHRVSDVYHAPVVCINQVSDFIDPSAFDNSSRKVIPALGLAWSACVNVRILIRRLEGLTEATEVEGVTSVVRRMQVVLAPHLPNDSCEFIVSLSGVHGIER